MRTLRRNRQVMYYSVPLSTNPIYVTDDDGNIVYYTDEEGNTYPLETGEYRDGYSEPVKFTGNISGELRQTLMSEFGVIASPNYAKLLTQKNEFDFVIGTLIWKSTEPVFDQGEVDPSSADYSVLGVIDEFIDEDTYYLHKRKK